MGTRARRNTSISKNKTMPINDIEVQVQTDRPPLYDTVPENLYECVISSISEGERPKFKNPSEKEKVINFEFTISQGIQKGKKLGKQVSPVIGTGFEGGNASTLYQMIYCVYRGVPKMGLKDVVNSLEGKHIKAMVKNKPAKSGKEYSRVTDFLASDAEQPVEEVPVIDIDEPSSDMPF